MRKMPEMIRNDNGTLAGLHLRRHPERDGHRLRRRTRSEFLAKKLTLPAGYRVEWTGLYQYTTAARGRLRIIIPVTLAIIFLLLVMAFQSVSEAFLVAMSVPFALAGGVFLQWALGYADDDGGHHRLHLGVCRRGADRHHHGDLHPRGARPTSRESQSFVDAVIEGSTARLRPKLMTVATIVLSLSLIPLSSGPGMEIMKPIAAPSIGGMVTSTLHVLFMTPCLFVIAEDIRRYWARRRGARHRRDARRRGDCSRRNGRA